LIIADNFLFDFSKSTFFEICVWLDLIFVNINNNEISFDEYIKPLSDRWEKFWPKKDRKLIYCNERIDTNQSIIDKLSPYKNSINKWAVLIGPEGGFSNHENKLLSESNDVLSVSLGEKLLRSDTAITVSLFIIQQLLV